MKILHVIDQLNAGGAERVCVDLANLSKQCDLSVGILVLLNESTLDSTIDPAVTVHYLRRGSKLNVKTYIEAARICNQYDIVHVHMRHVYRYMTLAKMLSNRKSKFILHDHFGDIRTQKKVPFLFGGFFKPQYYIGVSRELTTWAVQNLKIKEQKVFLLANIVRQSKVMNPSVIERDVVVVSNIRRTKNIEFAIQLAAALNLTLDIIGQRVDIAYYEELNEIIRMHSAEDKVHFVLDCYDVQSRLGKYRMALHTASSETGPLVLMEYLAQGTNFLAYHTGEVAEVLHSILPSFFMNTFEPEAWKERIVQQINNPIDKEVLFNIFKQNYSEEKYSDTCLKIYQSILPC